MLVVECACLVGQSTRLTYRHAEAYVASHVSGLEDIARLNGHEAIVRILAEPASKRRKAESSDLGPTDSGVTAGAASSALDPTDSGATAGATSSALDPTDSGATAGATSSAQGGAGEALATPPPDASSEN